MKMYNRVSTPPFLKVAYKTQAQPVRVPLRTCTSVPGRGSGFPVLDLNADGMSKGCSYHLILGMVSLEMVKDEGNASEFEV